MSQPKTDLLQTCSLTLGCRSSRVLGPVLVGSDDTGVEMWVYIIQNIGFHGKASLAFSLILSCFRLLADWRVYLSGHVRRLACVVTLS